MRVVTAGIIREGGKALICKRPVGKRLGGKWEFPGGKLESGETPEECLKRELYEELSITVKVNRIYDAKIDMESGEFIILYYFAEILSGVPTLLEHDEIAFVTFDEMSVYDFAGADKLVAESLISEKPTF